MNHSAQDFISVDEILSDALLMVDDEGMKDMSKGFYTSQIQQGLEELAFQTFFDERTEALPIGGQLRIPMPKGCFNIRQLYLFNGTKCDIASAVNIYWKRNYFTGGSGFVARDVGRSNRDPFYNKHRFRDTDFHLSNARKAQNNGVDPVLNASRSVNSEFFFNVQNGIIMLSASCRSFENLMIVYNGVGTDIGEVPFIPRFLRQPVVDYVTEKALRIKTAKDPNRWRALWGDAVTRLGREGRFGQGSWYRAEVFVKSMDTKAREDQKEYMARFNY